MYWPGGATLLLGGAAQATLEPKALPFAAEEWQSSTICLWSKWLPWVAPVSLLSTTRSMADTLLKAMVKLCP